MLTLMIMAQDYTAYEPVTSGVWIQKEKHPIQDKFENLKEMYMERHGKPKHTATTMAFNQCIDGGHFHDVGIVMCGDKVMGSYPYDRAIEIMKDIAIQTYNINKVLDGMLPCGSKLSEHFRYDSSCTYYMPQE